MLFVPTRVVVMDTAEIIISASAMKVGMQSAIAPKVCIAVVLVVIAQPQGHICYINSLSLSLSLSLTLYICS